MAEWSPTNKAEELICTGFKESHSEVHPNSVIEWAGIFAAIQALITAIRNCRNPQTAQAHMARGSVIARLQARRALRASKYEGNVPAVADKLIEKAVALSPEDRLAIVKEASDVPPEKEDFGPWPSLCVLLAFGLFLFAGTASAQDAGPWPQLQADVATIRDTSLSTSLQVSALTNEVADLKESLARIEAALSTPVVPPLPAPPVEKPNSPAVARSGGTTFNGRSINVQQFLARYNPSGSTSPGIIGSVDAHLAQHGFANFSSLSRTTKLQLHAAAHRTGVPARSTATALRSLAPANVGCANGQCSRIQSGYRVGLFGRLRPVYR